MAGLGLGDDDEEPDVPAVELQRGAAVESLWKLCTAYLEGLQWVMYYYYRGPDACGWKWFLPYYHAPLCLDLYRYIASEHYKPEHSHSGVPSDLATLGDTLPFGSSAVALEYLTDVNCEIDGPVNPFTQLMSVLPADSATLVPECLRPLFYGGPTKHFYPTNFAIDTDGVKVPWGGVTLIPFIDPHLLESML